jgi:hypothetical protein
MHSLNKIHTLQSHPSPFAEVPLHRQSFHHGKGAEASFELGTALQQADALLTELRRTLTELRHTLLNYTTSLLITNYTFSWRLYFGHF